MKINILKEENKPLLSRTEINIEIEFEGATPSKEEVKKEVAKLKKKDESLVAVKEIYVKFGSRKAKSLIYIYDNKKIMDQIEPKIKVKGGKVAKVKKEANE